MQSSPVAGKWVDPCAQPSPSGTPPGVRCGLLGLEGSPTTVLLLLGPYLDRVFCHAWTKKEDSNAELRTVQAGFYSEILFFSLKREWQINKAMKNLNYAQRRGKQHTKHKTSKQKKNKQKITPKGGNEMRLTLLCSMRKDYENLTAENAPKGGKCLG